LVQAVQVVLFFVVVFAVVWLVNVVLNRVVLRKVVRRALEGMPREQPLIFEERLRDFVFRNPYDAMELLFSDGREGFLRKLWDESKPPPKRAGFEPSLPSEGMSVYRTRLSDGRAIAVIEPPKPERDLEPHLFGVVVPQDQTLKADLARARKTTRFFVLRRGSSVNNNKTDLCGWTHDGKERNYNVEASLEPERFAVAVGDKLRELRL
jgi:hypothetical protein